MPPAAVLGQRIVTAVAVVGGGNSAMDGARAALRSDGVQKVYILYRRTRDAAGSRWLRRVGDRNGNRVRCHRCSPGVGDRCACDRRRVVERRASITSNGCPDECADHDHHRVFPAFRSSPIIETLLLITLRSSAAPAGPMH